jgi:hypothetical protein
MTAVGAFLPLTSFPRKRESILILVTKRQMDNARLLPRAVPAIRCANVRFGILPPQSRFRGNDDMKSCKQ